MIDWLNIGLPFAATGTPNALAPGEPQGGDTLTGAPLTLLAFTAPEELAAMMAKRGVRPGQMAALAAPPMMPGTTEMTGTPGVDTGAPSTGAMNTQRGLASTGGPAGLAGVPGKSSIAQALGAIKAMQPPAAPMVAAPSTPRIDSPPVYKPDASQLMSVMQMLSGGAQMPTLAQLMGGMR